MPNVVHRLVPKRGLAAVKVAHAVHDVGVKRKAAVVHDVESGAAIRFIGGGPARVP